MDYTLCCDATGAQINDPSYWEPNGGNLTICSCSVPQVGGVPYGGEVVLNGSCGDCRCTDINISDQDIQDSDNGIVYLYYQCCDGNVEVLPYGAQQQQFICLSRVIGIFFFNRGLFVPAPNSTYTYGAGCAVGFCVSCQSSC